MDGKFKFVKAKRMRKTIWGHVGTRNGKYFDAKEENTQRAVWASLNKHIDNVAFQIQVSQKNANIDSSKIPNAQVMMFSLNFSDSCVHDKYLYILR